MKRFLIIVLAAILIAAVIPVCNADDGPPVPGAGEGGTPIMPGGSDPTATADPSGQTDATPTPTTAPTTAPTSGGNSGSANSGGTKATDAPSTATQAPSATDVPIADATDEPTPEPTAEAVETVTTAPTDAPKAAETAAPVATEAPADGKTGGARLWIAVALAAVLAVAGGAFALIRWKGGKKA